MSPWCSHRPGTSTGASARPVARDVHGAAGRRAPPRCGPSPWRSRRTPGSPPTGHRLDVDPWLHHSDRRRHQANHVGKSDHPRQHSRRVSLHGGPPSSVFERPKTGGPPLCARGSADQTPLRSEVPDHQCGLSQVESNTPSFSPLVDYGEELETFGSQQLSKVRPGCVAWPDSAPACRLGGRDRPARDGRRRQGRATQLPGQENRSFDHYFGTLSGVAGFSDPRVLKQRVDNKRYPIFDQFGYTPGTGVDPPASSSPSIS